MSTAPINPTGVPTNNNSKSSVENNPKKDENTIFATKDKNSNAKVDKEEANITVDKFVLTAHLLLQKIPQRLHKKAKIYSHNL